MFFLCKNIFSFFCFAGIGGCCVINYVSITNETDKTILIVYNDKKIQADKNSNVLLPSCEEKEILLNDLKVISETDQLFIEKSKFIKSYNENVKNKVKFMPNFSCLGTDVVSYAYIKDNDGKLFLDYSSKMENDIKREGVRKGRIIKDQLRKR